MDAEEEVGVMVVASEEREALEIVRGLLVGLVVVVLRRREMREGVSEGAGRVERREDIFGLLVG